MTGHGKAERRKGTPRAWVARQMRLPLIIAAISCSFAHADESKSFSTKPRLNSKEMGLRLDVRDGGWGGAKREEIETVLYSVADELLSRLPKNLSVPIVVTHTDKNPVALYERGPAGEYQIRLHARGDNWHLYAYEFAHELCHILSNYEENVAPGVSRYNQWFEETLCETASLFVLKNLAETWEAAPPEAHKADTAKKLRRFFDHLLAEGHRQLPAHTPLVSWLDENESQLRSDPYIRDKNEVVANLLLPLFQEDPQNWEALHYLNLNPDDARNTLAEYLGHWYQNAPLGHKRFVAGVLALFKLDNALPMSAPALATSTPQN